MERNLRRTGLTFCTITVHILDIDAVYIYYKKLIFKVKSSEQAEVVQTLEIVYCLPLFTPQ